MKEHEKITLTKQIIFEQGNITFVELVKDQIWKYVSVF